MNEDLQKGYVRAVFEADLENSRDLAQWYLPHHPILNSNKPKKVRRVCYAVAKYHRVCLNDALMTDPDRLYGLIGMFMRFRIEQIVITADVEDMFPRISDPPHDQRTLRFLCAIHALERTASYNSNV